MSTNDVSQHPVVNGRYSDHRGRVLVVHTIQPGDSLGREVLGKLKWKGNSQAYSTTLAIFYAIWVKKNPPMKSSDMKVG